MLRSGFENRHAVRAESRVARHQHEVFGHRLRDQHAVEEGIMWRAESTPSRKSMRSCRTSGRARWRPPTLVRPSTSNPAFQRSGPAIVRRSGTSPGPHAASGPRAVGPRFRSRPFRQPALHLQAAEAASWRRECSPSSCSYSKRRPVSLQPAPCDQMRKSV